MHLQRNGNELLSKAHTIKHGIGDVGYGKVSHSDGIQYSPKAIVPCTAKYLFAPPGQGLYIHTAAPVIIGAHGKGMLFHTGGGINGGTMSTTAETID